MNISHCAKTACDGQNYRVSSVILPMTTTVLLLFASGLCFGAACATMRERDIGGPKASFNQRPTIGRKALWTRSLLIFDIFNRRRTTWLNGLSVPVLHCQNLHLICMCAREREVSYGEPGRHRA